jgi:ubiquinone/menaquinone biosynthesis C-methylase UbiE
MDENLKAESERLVLSWMQHDSEWLKDYLIQEVEDPRINLQSILSRHFLLRALFKEQFLGLMEQEYRFSACMSWLQKLVRHEIWDSQEVEAVLYALRHGADNAEGLAIPQFIGHMFRALPTQASEFAIPNYIESFLQSTKFLDGKRVSPEPVVNTFQFLWVNALATYRRSLGQPPGSYPDVPRVLEPACGSANDYRFLHAYGITDFLNYTGFDLCEKNIQNARALFPDVRFELGNVFEIKADDQAFEYCFVHDLFEHFSPEGLTAAVREICRVTRLGLCAGFFNMDELPDHIVQPLEHYHWNTLSLPLMRKMFANHGFSAQLLHVGTFLRQKIGCFETHNPNAYTFFLWRP